MINPEDSDAYLAGIICDGKNYAMARTAHDRDVLRSDMLCAMGWKLFHVWSLSWFRNAAQEQARLLAFLESCKKEAARAFLH